MNAMRDGIHCPHGGKHATGQRIHPICHGIHAIARRINPIRDGIDAMTGHMNAMKLRKCRVGRRAKARPTLKS